ncbi:MAG TPA: sialidase family protein [Pyrinomonadaceae bacterium]|nr:sialidase family protein [Pyrinomonadaceae bacterium]
MKNFRERAALTLLLFMCAFSACATRTDIVPARSDASRTLVQLSSAETDAAEPAAAADGNGNLYVLYVEHAQDKSADLFLRKFDASLNGLGGPVRINPTRGEARAWQGDPPTIKIGPNGDVYVGWTSRSEEGAGTILWLSVSRDSGASFEPPVKVNDDALPASHGMHSLAVDGRNRVYVAWLDERNLEPEHAVSESRTNAVPTNGYYVIPADHKQHLSGNSGEAERQKEPNSEVFFAISDDGGRTFSANQRIASNVCPCCKTALAIGPDDRIYAAWRQVVGDNFRHIAVASSNDGGGSFGPAVIVSDDQWQIAACPVSGPVLSTDTSGLSVYWYTAGLAGQPGIYTARSANAGKTFSPRQLISSETASGTPALILGQSGDGLVFNAKDKTVAVETSGKVRIIGEGSNPAAASVSGRSVVAFVKTDGETRSVWITAIG